MVIGEGNTKRNNVFFWPRNTKGRSLSYIMFKATKPHSVRFGNINSKASASPEFILEIEEMVGRLVVAYEGCDVISL